MTTMTAEPEVTAEPIAAHVPETLGEFLEILGDVDPADVLWVPMPGTGTEADLLGLPHKLFELIDGTLVKKSMGVHESIFAGIIAALLSAWNDEVNAGVVTVPDGGFRLAPGLVRLPDVSFTAWGTLPSDTAHLESVAAYSPDLAVEVLSASDRPGASRRKLGEYFAHGTRLVWVFDPKNCVVVVHTGASTSTTLSRTDTLEGGDLLPGFSLPLSRVFDRPQLHPRRPHGA